MINIVTSFYIAKSAGNEITDRNNELVNSLKKNLESNFIEKVYLFVDNDECYTRLKELFSNYINNEKIKVIEIGKKPLYSDLFQYAIEKLRNKICMITNSDIYLKECDIGILKSLVHTKTAYSISRHEHDGTPKQIDNYYGSHDAFFFYANNINIDIVNDLKFVQNHWGSEGRVMGELINQGIKVFNPCRQIIINHLHSSEVREADRPWIGNHTYGNIAEFINSASFCPPVVLNKYF